MTKITLGDEVKDPVSGFQGIVISSVFYLFGCNRLGVRPKKLVAGKMVEVEFFDAPQLEIVKKNKVKAGKPVPDWTMDLGDRVKDVVSGFEGIVNNIVFYLSGDMRIAVIPKVDEEGKQVDGSYFYPDALSVVDKCVVQPTGDRPTATGRPKKTEEIIPGGHQKRIPRR